MHLNDKAIFALTRQELDVLVRLLKRARNNRDAWFRNAPEGWRGVYREGDGDILSGLLREFEHARELPLLSDD